MKYWMVRALGDSYGELAEMVAEWLTQEGDSVIPLLKKGFIPDGKRAASLISFPPSFAAYR